MTKDTPMARTKRMRVKGTGPFRDELVMFKKIGTISSEAVAELNKMLDDMKDRNDIHGDNYEISNAVDCDTVFGQGETYRQILMQERKDKTTNIVDEFAYNNWAFDVKVQNELSNYFDNVYRFRMSEMMPGASINWHIDTCTSVMCRAQICLNENDSLFEFRGRDRVVQSFTMKPGELWFINTAWNHRVVSGDMTRRVAVFGYHFDNLINKDLVGI